MEENKQNENVEATEDTQQKSQTAEEILDLLGIVSIVLGTVSALVIIFTVGITSQKIAVSEYSHETVTVYNWVNFVHSGLILFFSVLTWGVLKVLVNISNNLNKIRENTEK